MTDPAPLLTAVRFAANKHRLQRRKDGHTPYINHPIAVAEILSRVGGVTDLATLQAALLHDTLEDTDTTAEELEKEFGTVVRSMVQEVTSDKRLPQATRKQLQIEHAPHLSSPAALIKIADKICNISDITAEQPPGWPLQRKLEYLEWAGRVVDGCQGHNTALEKYFYTLARELRSALRTP